MANEGASQAIFAALTTVAASFTGASVVDTQSGFKPGNQLTVAVQVEAVTGNSSVAFTPFLSQSPDQTTWTTFVYPYPSVVINAPGSYGIPAPKSARYLRLDGTVYGSSLGATLVGVVFSAKLSADWPT